MTSIVVAPSVYSTSVVTDMGARLSGKRVAIKATAVTYFSLLFSI